MLLAYYMHLHKQHDILKYGNTIFRIKKYICITFINYKVQK